MCLPQLSLIVIGGSSGSGLGPTSYFQSDLAGLRLQGDDEAAAGAALVAGDGGDELLERAAGDDQLAVGEDRRGEGEVQRMGAGELLAPRAQLPALLARSPGRARRSSRRCRAKKTVSSVTSAEPKMPLRWTAGGARSRAFSSFGARLRLSGRRPKAGLR